MEKQRWEESEKRREEKKKEDQRRERMRRKKTHEREKVEKSRNTLFSQWFVMICGSGGSKSRLAKAAGAKSKVLKNWQVRSIFGSWDVEKVHAVAAQRCAKHIWKSKVLKTEAFGAKSTFGSQKCEKLTGSERRAHFEVKNVKNWQVRIIFGSWDVEKVHTVGAKHFWKLRCSKSARRCSAKHISKSKCTKHTSSGPLLEVEMSEKCTLLWHEARFQVKILKTPHARFAWQAHGFVHLVKSEQNVRAVVACPKTMAGMGHLKRICKDTFSGAGAVQETCSWEILGSLGADFLRGFAFWGIRSSGLLRWFYMTSAALRMTWHHFFVAGAAF